MDKYTKIKEQRATILAPVDTIGCASTPEEVSEEERKFYILVGLLLSSQTKDEVTHEAVKKLKLALGRVVPEAVKKAPIEVLHNAIKKVGYHNKKVVFLKKIGEILSGNSMPTTLHEVLSLPGIGKKMAYLYLQHACGKCEGIGVDTHVHRVSNRIGLISTSSPETSRQALKRILPLEEWPVINSTLVGFGQVICLPVRPKCNVCLISDTCPSSRLKKS